MYKIFIKNLEGFEKLFENDERLKIVKPLFLLKDIDIYNNHRALNTDEYRNLCKIINMAAELKDNSKYHGFGILLTELHLQYFNFDMNREKEQLPNISSELLEYQISLLHQFTFPAYYN